MLITFLTSKQLGCKNTIKAWGTPTKKLQGDPDLISMPKLLKGGMGSGGANLKRLAPPLMACQTKTCK
jgi:hypothetical protein